MLRYFQLNGLRNRYRVLGDDLVSMSCFGARLGECAGKQRVE